MHIRWTFWFLLACDNNAADPRLWPCVLVLCFLFSENKVTRVSDSKWEGFDCTNTRMIASKWIHPNPPLYVTIETVFRISASSSVHHLMNMLFIIITTYRFFESNFSDISVPFNASIVLLGSETLKWRQVQIWKGSIPSSTKYVTKVSYYSSYHREGALRKPSFDPTKFLHRG